MPKSSPTLTDHLNGSFCSKSYSFWLLFAHSHSWQNIRSHRYYSFFFFFFFTDFFFNSFQTFARFLHWFITCLNVFVISLFHQMTVNTFYRHSIYTMKKGDNFGFFMRGKYQFILMFVVATHVFAKCLQKQGRGGGLLKYFFLREGLRVTALLKWYKST